MNALPFGRDHRGWSRTILACALLAVLTLLATGALTGRAASTPAAPMIATQPVTLDTVLARQCRPLLPPKPRPYPGIGNPDAGAPLGDYGDAPDGPFPFPTGSLIGNFPTLWHHSGAFTRIVTQEWLGRRVSTERGASDPLDPDGHPNLLYLGTSPLAANLDCYNDSQPSLDLAHRIFQANVSVAASAPRVRRVLNVVADLNISGAWNAPREWVVRNCVFLVPSGSFTRIQCPLVASLTPVPAFTQGIIVKPTGQVCPPKVWYRILLTRSPIVAGTVPGPWNGWDGRGPRQGFAYGEVEDYLCPCSDGTDHTPTPTATTTPQPSATSTRVPVDTPTGVPSATATRPPEMTATPTATATCVPIAGATPCAPVTATPTQTAIATPTCAPNPATVACQPTVTATATCVPGPNGTGCQATATVTATPTCVPSTTGVPCQRPRLDIGAKRDYSPTTGAIVFCLAINPGYAPVNGIYDLEWLGAPWTGATPGSLPAGWSWDSTFVGGKRAFTTNTPPWPTAGQYCFGLGLPPGTNVPAPTTIDVSNQLGQITGYLLAY